MKNTSDAKIQDIFVRTHQLRYEQRAIFKKPIEIVGSERLQLIADLLFRGFMGSPTKLSLVRIPQPRYGSQQLYIVDNPVVAALRKHVTLGEAVEHSALEDISPINDSISSISTIVGTDFSHALHAADITPHDDVYTTIMIDHSSRVIVENYVPTPITIYADWRESPPSKRSNIAS